jgi:Neocarzinostatin family
MRTRSFPAILGLTAGLILVSCSSSTKHASTSTSAAPTSTLAVPTSTSAAPSGQHLTITPSTGLASSATVQLEATGFSAGESLVVTQCASKGSATGEGDCNLAGIQSVTADSAGEVNTKFTVIKGPFGSSHIVCNSSGSCLVSVSQASPSPTQEADAPVSFG